MKRVILTLIAALMFSFNYDFLISQETFVLYIKNYHYNVYRSENTQNWLKSAKSSRPVDESDSLQEKVEARMKIRRKTSQPCDIRQDLSAGRNPMNRRGSFFSPGGSG